MIAIVPAAGRGTRLGALTIDRPKALVEVGDRPVLERVVEALVVGGVDQVVVVVGHLGHLVEEAVQSMPWPVTVVHQPQPLGTAHALLAAREVVGANRFVYAWGDLVAPPSAFAEVARVDGNALAVNRVDDPHAGAAVRVDADGWVTDIVEKPPPGTSATPFNASGIGALDSAAWGHLESVSPSPRGEFELTAALASMIAAGARFKAVEVGPVFDIGTPDGLAAARAWAASQG